jgi:hypothetical protein
MINLNLEEKYVAFLDVLGFSEMVGKEDTTRLQIYFNKVLDAFEVFDKEKATIQKLMVSDSIILIAPKTKVDFKILIRAIQSIQTYLIKEGIILRGAVSKGKVYYDETNKLIVGQGYIRAYKLEAEAIYPRVIIDPAIILDIAEDRIRFFAEMSVMNEADAMKNIPLIDNRTNSPLEDAISVDYAGRILTEAYNNDDTKDLKEIYEFVRKNLYSNQATYSKYLWLKNHFAEKLADYGKNLKSWPNVKRKDFFDNWGFFFDCL